VSVGWALLLLAAGWGGWYWLNHPPRPWLVRWRVDRFLQKQALTRDFATPFAFPGKEVMDRKPGQSQSAAAPEGTKRRSFDALREEYFQLKTAALVLDRRISEHAAQVASLTEELAALSPAGATNAAEQEAKAGALRKRLEELGKDAPSASQLAEREKALQPLVRELWDCQRDEQAQVAAVQAAPGTVLAKARAEFAARQREQMQKAGTYSEMYRLIGQELWVARQLLEARNPEVARLGITTALEAARHALTDAQNGWVAARICEGYVWPHLALADDTNRRSPFHPENLLKEIADIFQRNDEPHNVVRTYQASLGMAGTPGRRDWARVQIAGAYEQAGDLRNAVRYLKQIEDTNDNRWVMRRLPRMEQQLKVSQ
jgi:hypothetical protein